MFPQGLYGMNITSMWADEQYDPFDNRAKFETIFLFWPRRCCITTKWMWLSNVIRGTAVWTGPGEPIEECRYYNKAEYLMRALKNA